MQVRRCKVEQPLQCFEYAGIAEVMEVVEREFAPVPNDAAHERDHRAPDAAIETGPSPG